MVSVRQPGHASPDKALYVVLFYGDWITTGVNCKNCEFWHCDMFTHSLTHSLGCFLLTCGCSVACYESTKKWKSLQIRPSPCI